MTKTNTIWKRLLSMALACIMVLGYIPVDAFAQEAVTAAPLTATLVLQDTIEEEVPVESSESEEPSEGEEPSEEPAPVAEVTYTYTYVYRVTVQDQTGADVTDSAAITWQDGTSGATLSTKNNTGITANVAYNGLTLAVSVLDTPVAWSAGASWSSIAAGSAIDAAVPVYGEGSGISGAVWTTVITDAAGNEIAAGIDAGAALINTPLTTTLTLKNGDTTLYTLTQTADVTYAAAEYTFSKESGWFTAMPEVVVTAVTAEDPALIAPVVVGEQVLNSWVAGETEGTYTITVPAAEDELSKTISAGGKSVTLNVDNAAVIVNSASAVADKEGTHVKFDYSVGKSGAKVDINGVETTLSEGTGTFEQLIGQVFSGTITITLTNEVGATASTTCDVVPYISLSEADGIIGVKGGVNYVAVKAPYVSYTALNASGNVTWTVKSGEVDATYTVSEDGKTIHVNAPLSEGVNVTATDAKGRNVSKGLAAVAVDEVEPEIEITGLNSTVEVEDAAAITYSKDVQTYQITVTDDIALGDIKAFYYLTDSAIGNAVEMAGGVGQFKVEGGQRLTKIEVKAKDASGNPNEKIVYPNVEVDTTNPTMTASIAAFIKDENGEYTIPTEVKALYSNGDKDYLKFDAVESNKEDVDGSINVVVTFTATDANLVTDDTWINGVKTVSQEIVENTVALFEIAGITVTDRSGRVPVEELAINIGGDDTSTRLKMTLENGVYSGSVYVDRRTPTDNTPEDTEVPKVTLSAKSGYTTLGETRIFKGDIATFGLAVKDDSGLDVNVKAVVEGTGVSLDSDPIQLDTNGAADIKVNVTPGVEATDCTLNVTVTDRAGNYYLYIEKFGVDSKAPVVSYTKVPTDGEAAKSEGKTYFYQGDVTLTFSMTDLLPSSAEIVATIENYRTGATYTKPVSLSAEKLSDTITVTDGEWLTKVEITAADTLGNEYTPQPFTESLVVDAKDPEIADFVLVTEDGKPAKGTEGADGVIYYAKKVTLKTSATDDHFESGLMAYTLNGTGYSQGMTYDEETKQWNTSITIDDGDLLTGVETTAVDKSGNSAEKKYGEMIAVDNTVPKITIVKELVGEAQYIQTVGGKAYYNGGVTYTVTVTDNAINPKVTYLNVNNSESNVGWTLVTDKATGRITSMTASFTVIDGNDVTAIKMKAADMAGHYAAVSDITVIDNVLTETDIVFSNAENNVLTYTGPVIVVDMTDPEATLALTGNIHSLVEKNGVYYVKLKTPVTGENGEEADKENEFSFTGNTKDEVVTLTLTVEDQNISLAKNDENDENLYIYNNTDDSEWTPISQVGETKMQTTTYTDSVAVGMHETDFFVIDVGVFDMVGHPMNLTVKPLSNSADTTGEGAILPIEANKGLLKATISVDRRTPSTSDETAPEITLKNTTENGDSAENKFKNAFGRDLYKIAPTFELNVKDGKDEEETQKHSGLKLVKWDLNDSTGVITKASKETPFADYTPGHKEDIAISGAGETDNAVLTIEATDNVDNTITYAKQFAFDNLAPRVTVTVSGTSARQNKYYKEDRTATVVIEDLHLPELGSTLAGKAFEDCITVTTQENVKQTGWTKVGIRYENTYTFDQDGEYTFEVTAQDVLGNVSEVEYKGENPTEFIVDKTKPTIKVTYSPAAPSGRDGKGVSYYDQYVTAMVTITERNFNQADVQPAFRPAAKTLTNFTTDIEHKASVTFAEGNEYSFDINFQDLAGNPAEPYKSHVFSVDTHAPTINITRGDLSNDDLNIVQGDLVLGFTINDKQQNLSDYKVTVTHLNNDFKTTEVLGSEYYTVVTQEERTTVVVNFNAIKKEKLNDGLYTVDISARDYAGNAVVLTPNLDFSLNRFGSTFTTSDAFTTDFLATGSDGNVYHDSVSDKLVIQEINPNRVWNDSSKKVEGSILTVVVNGTSTRLVEGEDYTMSVEQHGTGNTKWYVYTYEIDPDSFKENDALVDGRYSILIYGEDEAGNKNTNESNVSGGMQKDADGKYTGKIEFVLDTTAPIITTTGIESGKNYNAEAQRMEIFLSDNTPATIAVYLNGTLINLAEAMEGLAGTAAWLVYNPETGSYILNVPELNTLFEGQNVRIVVTDAAGNETELVVDDFSVSTNFFVRMMNNGLLIGGVIVLMLLLILLLVFKLKRRKLV